jgi:hypothetical protein
MDLLTTLNEAFQAIIPMITTLLAVWLIIGIRKVAKEASEKSSSELVDKLTDKYFKMLETTVTNAVLATTQTYVEALKKENAFDKEAQEKAFNMTYETVMKVLTDEAKRYLEAAVGDLELYTKNLIEATVKLTK